MVIFLSKFKHTKILLIQISKKTVTITADKNSLIELKSRQNTRYTFVDVNKGTIGTGTGTIVCGQILVNKFNKKN
jgi:hypothetical protein